MKNEEVKEEDEKFTTVGEKEEGISFYINDQQIDSIDKNSK